MSGSRKLKTEFGNFGDYRTLYWLAALALVIVLYILALISPDRKSISTDQIDIRLKTSDLATGAVSARPNDYVTLVVTEKGKPGSAGVIVSNVSVLELSAADGHSVAYTGEAPDSVLLGLPQEEVDKVVQALQNDKKVIYLRPQSGQIPTPPSNSARATATPALSPPVFTLAGKIAPVKADIPEGKEVIIMLVVPILDNDGKVSTYETGSYDATLVDALDKADIGATHPAVKLSVGPRDPAVAQFVRQLSHADMIYVLPVEVETPAPAKTP